MVLPLLVLELGILPLTQEVERLQLRVCLVACKLQLFSVEQLVSAQGGLQLQGRL